MRVSNRFAKVANNDIEGRKQTIMTNATFAAGEQVREYGERASETSKVFGRQAIDAYEQVVKSAVEFEKAAADVAPADWIKTAVGAHASFVQDVNAAYVSAARTLLS
jgi:hypothetical protein